LTSAQAAVVLDRLYAGGILFLRVLGGEPFFRKDFPFLLREAAAKGMLISFSTNAALVTKESARLIKEIEGNINYFQVSLYGTNPADYAKFTKNPRAMELVLRGVDNLREQGLKPYVFWVLTHENIEETVAAYDLVKSAGLPALRISPKLNLGRASEEVYSDKSETSDYWGRAVKMLRDLHQRVSINGNPTVQLHARPLLGEYLFQVTGIPFFFITCKAATTMAYVNARGECSPCPFADYMPDAFRKEVSGRPLSLLDHGLVDIWQSELFQSYRRRRSSISSAEGVFVNCPHNKSGLCEPCMFTPCTCRSTIQMIRQALSAQDETISEMARKSTSG
jgi:MoaA/NifB/PqqE/SkfB family radical SAM enzyme